MYEGINKKKYGESENSLSQRRQVIYGIHTNLHFTVDENLKMTLIPQFLNVLCFI